MRLSRIAASPTRLGLPNIATWSTVKGRIMSGIGAAAAAAVLASQYGIGTRQRQRPDHANAWSTRSQ
jgi:hypothetical protein